MRATPEAWADLEAAAAADGTDAYTRMSPGGPLDLRLGVTQPGLDREFAAVLPRGAVASAAGLQTRGLRISVTPGVGSTELLTVVLVERGLEDVFDALVNDLADASDPATAASPAATLVVARLASWKELLTNAPNDGLSRAERMGLWGELDTLRHLAGLGVSQGPLVAAWVASTAPTDQDFEFAGAAVEVKTTTRRARTIDISSERQLDDVGTPHLVLVALQVDERRGGDGESLNGLVDTVTSLVTDPTARGFLADGLAARLYLRSQRSLYDEPRYTVRIRRTYEVREGFPRLVPADLPEGVTNVKYTLALDALGPFETTDPALAGFVGGGA